MQSSISIQTYQPSFQQQIIDLILNIQQNEFQIPITIADQPDLLNIDTFYQVNDGNFWCAINDTTNEVIGTISMIDRGDSFGTIRKMFVRADYRGKQWNLASSLLEILENHALKHHKKALYLGTKDILQAAQTFYLKKGFFLIDEKELPATFPRMPVDNRFYQKNL